jgi:hypothetical protein
LDLELKWEAIVMCPRVRFCRWPTIVAVLVIGASVFAGAERATAVTITAYVSATPSEGAFALATSGVPVPLVASGDDFPGVLRAASDLQADLERVTGNRPALSTDAVPAASELVLIGTLGRSPLVDRLVREKKLNVAGVAGRWEAFLIEVVDQPLPGVDRALVIAGSDKRGTIFGIYELAAQCGVSPWYWWADVPVAKRRDLYVRPGRHVEQPAVKYRGIFINDEAPALANWMQEKFGGHNHKFYKHVFELILRLKGNYLWPAMWGRSIYEDDPESQRLADEWGVVIATSHHEPMMRAHVDWQRNGTGRWDYEKNEAVLREFWAEGIRRTKDFECVVTVGMRGDGDEPMTEEANIALLERIVADQRQILADVTGKVPAATPQMWALYKEVQEYYDKGMRVPDDVTLLLCDDNWGNIRKLPKLADKPRAGGYGIYYHFDYVGGPRNYKWLNTNQIERVWEQMHLAYRYGADRVWIVNVGDIKPMELPIEFFLDYAWNPEAWPAERLPEYTRRWAAVQFGDEHAAAIAAVFSRYTRYNARRKPELLAPNTYSLVNYREAERVVAEYNELADVAARIGQALPTEYRDAYYQLVLFPVQACANLNELYVAAGQNRLYAEQGRAATNELADRVRALFARDAALTEAFHTELAGGKWNHMMSQTHIGYTYWQQPDRNVMPKVQEIDVPVAAEMGVAIEGSERGWPNDEGEPVLPELSPYGEQRRYLEVFNRGRTPFTYTIEAAEPWLSIESDPASGEQAGTVETEQRLWIGVDWDQAPTGKHEVPVTISGPGDKQVIVHAIVNHPAPEDSDHAAAFVESGGCVSIEAEHYTRAVDVPPIRWQRIPNLGRTVSAMTPLPVTAESQSPGDDCPRLEYRVRLFNGGDVKVRAYVSPTLNFQNTTGLRYAISFDDQEPQIVNLHTDQSLQAWERWVADSVNVTVTDHHVAEPGPHVLKFWMVDPGVVLQKLVIDTGGVEPSYLGPPESHVGSAAAAESQ